jgi:hypothetical protein
MAIENEDALPGDEELDNDVVEAEEDDGQGEQDGQSLANEGSEEPAAQGQGSEESTERPLTRGENRFQRLSTEARRAAAEAKEARETAAQARRELEEFRAQQQRQAQLPDPRLEAERIAAMSPDERAQYYISQERERSQREMGQLRFEMADQADRTRFDALKASNPIAARLAPKVEEYLASERRAGRNYDRSVIMTFLAGQEALAKVGKAATTQRAQGAQRIAQQRTRPGNGASDVPRGNSRSEKSLEEKLADVVF